MNNKLDWFRDAKYGLFIHWGLYAIPGGIWNGENIPHGSEWIMKNAQIPKREYEKLVPQFNPDRFDAEYYARKAKEWGMKYLCVTAKHHDGFAMYDTKVDDYSVMHTPYGKDVVRQLADACKKYGITFCVYYSQMQDWHDPNGNGNTWDYRKEDQNFETYFYGKVIPQVSELLTNYGKIGMIWFDTPYDMPKPLCEELAKTVRACQPDCLINGRIGYGIGDYRQAADNHIPTLATERAWESPMTMNHSWGYSYWDKNFKTSKDVISTLVTVVGKGGNVLLNVGPDCHGEIPAECEQPLNEAGQWLKTYGDSIYGTRAVPTFPYLQSFGSLTYDAKNYRLFFHITKYPIFPYQILLSGMETKAKRAYLVSTGEELKTIQTYEIARDEHRFKIQMPEQCPDPFDTVVCVELESECVPQEY